MKTGEKLKLFFFAAISVAAALGQSGCSSDHKSSSTPAPTTISGSVAAPTATLALLERRGLLERMFGISTAIAQSGGLVPVPNANILVFRIDDNGQPVGDLIAQTTTDGSGNYSLTLPPGTSLGSNLVVQATGQNVPRPVGQANQQNCPATTPTLDLTPTAEYATRALIAGITRNSSTLGNFTTDEINSIIGRIISLAQNAGGSTIQEVIDNVAAIADPEAQRFIDNASTPGETPPPQGLGGVYNIVSFGVEYQGNSEQLRREIGTVNINVSAKTFAVSSDEAQVELSETCTADQNSPCARSFTRIIESQDNSDGGSIILLPGNLIAFQDDEGSGPVGSYTAAGDVIVINDENGLIVALKQPTSAPTMSGNYQAAQIGSTLADSFSVAEDTPFATGNASTGLNTVTITGANLSGVSSGSKMSKQITCLGSAQNNCADTETLTSGSEGGQFTATVSVNASGVLTVTPDNDPGTRPGAVSPDGSLFVLADGNAAEGDTGIIIGMKEASGMTTASLAGTYSFAGMQLELGSNRSNSESQGGTITLNANGNLTGNLTGVRRELVSNCSNGYCPVRTTNDSTETDAPAATFSVSPIGEVTVVGDGDEVISGFASADGRIIVLTARSDGTIGGQSNDSSNRALYVLIK